MFVLAKTYASVVYRETISVATDATNFACSFAHLKTVGATASLSPSPSFHRVIIYANARECCPRQVETQKAVRLITSKWL